ncbi:hypothetical protein ASF10_19635 [Flavobacterium sp. Leaf82]|uniref:hypothetical protein n=1 Tax=unclassified Flavobacterium TaxID=196869 RepID=UPI0006F8A51B|nr:hypothetical protein [Flavobacterium sp. Leaf82]KQO33013.1 hypothetical protein ASF10_19635 [Flavobacterium sp. Leaf82]
MKKQDIEDIFSSMENFSSVPPPELWGQIEEKLDKPKKKKRAILWWSAAACLLLGLLLPSILHFSSTSGIKTIQGDSQKNSVVLDKVKDNLNPTKTTSTQENNPEQIAIENQPADPKDSSSLKNTPDQLNNAVKNQNQKTTVAHTNAKTSNNPDGLDLKPNKANENINQAVAEKTIVSDQKNGFNSGSQSQIATADKKVSNQNLTEKAIVSGKENSFNSASKNQIANADKKVSNQNLTEKAIVSGKENSFNAASKNQIANADKKVSNPTLAEKAAVSAKTNSFNTASKNQFANADKKSTDKILAEKTFVAGTVNPFNPSSKNQLSKSIFEEQSASKNNKNIASNTSNSYLKDNNAVVNESALKQDNERVLLSKELASTQKSNSKFNDVLSKQDSVQLAELQNLEKGIITPETKKEKEDNKISKGEKWAVEVFAGVASSENYKNDKTFGNSNDSKQSNTYGVKTKYKINKKWAVGSGFKINELGQSVANVSYLSTKNAAFFSSNDYFNLNTTAAAPKITTNADYVFVPNSTTNAIKENDIQSNNIQTGNLDQNLRYIEMPVEVSYSVFSKNKASINLNTGGFVGKLISNNVALDGNSLGQNINANDYVYGSTLSSTLQYRVYKKTNVFVEPAMNYYINPLNNQSFNQFQWGLNFGLNVSF